MQILKQVNLGKKDVIKASNTTICFKDRKDALLTVNGVLIMTKEETDTDSGEVKENTVTCVRTTDGEYITSISPTVRNSVELLLTQFNEEELAEGIECIIRANKSNSGRDFYILDLA